MRLILTTLICLGLVAGLWAGAPIALADDAAPPKCSTTIKDHAAALAEAYGETPYWLGFSGASGSRGDLVMIFTNPDQTSWTVVVIERVTGRSCSLTGGDAWMARPPKNQKDA